MQPRRVTTTRRTIPPQRSLRDGPVVATRSLLLWLAATGFAWLGLVSLIVVFPWDPQVLDHHWLLAAAAALVAVTTCAPVALTLHARGLTVRGVCGAVIVSHLVVFTAAPTRTMLALPEMPVYALLAIGCLWLVAGFAMPITYAIGTRVYANRQRRFDVRRAQRQAFLLGVTVSGVVVLIGLRAFTPLLAGLWCIMVVFFEYIVLTYTEPVERPA